MSYKKKWVCASVNPLLVLKMKMILSHKETKFVAYNYKQ